MSALSCHECQPVARCLKEELLLLYWNTNLSSTGSRDRDFNQNLSTSTKKGTYRHHFLVASRGLAVPPINSDALCVLHGKTRVCLLKPCLETEGSRSVETSEIKPENTRRLFCLLMICEPSWSCKRKPLCGWTKTQHQTPQVWETLHGAQKLGCQLIPC